MTAALQAIAELLERESGIRLADPRYGALRAAIQRAAPGAEPRDFLRLVGDPARRAEAIGRLLDEVTVQESAFLRERRALEDLRWSELLAAAGSAGQEAVRVWVSACAHGEEAYTLAMLACEAFGSLSPPVEILATDISRQTLSRAEAATYRERALRGLDPERRKRWLRPEGERAIVCEEIRRLVRFRRHNLVREAAPPPGEARFHVVTCRNVLIYFDPVTARSVAARLQDALAPGGVLLLGAADTLSATTGRLAAGSLDADSTSASGAGRTAPTRAAPREVRLALAHTAADEDRAADALTELTALVRRDPLDAEAHALLGVIELAQGDTGAAVAALRRALYADAHFGAAAFMLARAHDAAGHRGAARRAYAQALRSLGRGDVRDRGLLGDLDPSAALAECRAALQGA